MTKPVRTPAIYADLEKVPPRLVAEIIQGEIVTHPRPTPRHARAMSRLNATLGNPFDEGEGGPGGWIFLIEPELHLGADVLVSDLAAWRIERLPEAPKRAYVDVAPDWVCEILSDATADYDRGAKRASYGKAGVSYLWLLDPRDRQLECFQLVAENWMLIGMVSSGESVTMPPFDAITFPLDKLFPFDIPKNTTSQG
jgi:Uma2 family endonuclease